MIVGFTGTRAGMINPQLAALDRLLAQLTPTLAHHGDCVGADAQFHHYAREMVYFVVHPPTDFKLRAFCAIRHGDILLDPLPYKERNKAIVTSSELLIAAPRQDQEDEPARGARGEGTWMTINYAIDHRVPVTIIWPDGETEER